MVPEASPRWRRRRPALAPEVVDTVAGSIVASSFDRPDCEVPGENRWIAVQFQRVEKLEFTATIRFAVMLPLGSVLRVKL
jgi:hypothetical protein